MPPIPLLPPPLPLLLLVAVKYLLIQWLRLALFADVVASAGAGAATDAAGAVGHGGGVRSRMNQVTTVLRLAA